MNNQRGNGSGRIMVVEDEPVIGEFCHRVLAADGFTVDTASQGRSAKELAQRRNYDLIIIDLRMPVMNGREFFHYLREKHPTLARRVVFITGDIISGQTRQFIGESHRPFLPKPFTPNELRGIVRETLRRIAT